MRLTATFPIIAAFLVPMMAGADVPPEVMTAYKAYNAAMDSKDYAAALKHGEAAWKTAEKKMGDSKTTGDLAFNYGLLARSRGQAHNAMKPLERSVELAVEGREKGEEVRLERSVELVAAAEAVDDAKAVKKYASKAIKQAKAAGLEESVFVGEILVHKAQHCSKVANRAASRIQRNQNTASASRMAVNKGNKVNTAKIQKKCMRDAKKAADVFKNNPNSARPKYVSLAAKQIGIGYERQDEWLNAALSYQTARLTLEDKFGRENPVVMQMIGRWINARARLDYGDKLDEAKAAGLCDCWPFDQGASKVALVKRKKLDIPTRVDIQSSGVVVLKADITDAGTTSNIQTVYSWPQGQYDEKALKAFKQFQYAPKTSPESEGARKNVIYTFNINIIDESTKKTY